MAKDPDREWQLAMTSLIAEVKANQENLHTKLNEYCKEANDRQTKMEHIVIGNGKPGLAEDVRNLKGKWAAFYGLGFLLLSAVLNYAVESSIYNRQVANSHATAVESTAAAEPR
jgi:hypothetical protein